MNSVRNEKLNQLKGLTARLWDFSPSHDRLVYRINDTKDDLERYLIFVECDAISTLVFWKILNPKFSKEGDFLVIEDNNLKVTCRELLLENGYTLEYFNEKYSNSSNEI
jgi:hypothetical protein